MAAIRARVMAMHLLLARASGRAAAAAAGAPRSGAGRRRLAHSAAATAADLDAVADAAAPPLPLCERPAAAVAELAAVLAWRDDALRQVAALPPSWAAGEPDAPTPDDLRTELGWLLDDAVAAVAAGGAAGGAAAWRPAAWRDLERGGGTAAPSSLLQLRAPLGALADAWRARLRDRVPLQYLVAAAHWRDVVLAVGPGVLIPRPETELLLDFALEAAAAQPAGLAAAPWADLGTGSGALAVALARALPAAAAVFAVDASPAARAAAALNARRLGVGGRVRVAAGSWWEPLAGAPPLAGALSNPPYVASEALPALQAEVRRHEPALALDGGAAAGGGLDALRAVCAGAAARLAPAGFLGLETGGGAQADAVAALLRAARGGAGGSAFADVRVRADLRGVRRFVTAVRTSN